MTREFVSRYISNPIADIMTSWDLQSSSSTWLFDTWQVGRDLDGFMSRMLRPSFPQELSRTLL